MMSDANKLSLKVMINKDKTKVIFAESDNHLVDILLSFLTLPLGKIARVFNNNAIFGSLSTFYHSLQNLDSSHFVTEGAKRTLLESMSSFEHEYAMLKLDISDSPPAAYFFCTRCTSRRFSNVSAFFGSEWYCSGCEGKMNQEVVEKSSCDGVFTKPKASFLISDDLLILPNETEFFEAVSIFEITETDKAEQIEVHFGLTEIVKLLKTSLTSPTPLSDVILNKTTKLNHPAVESPVKLEGDNPNLFTLKVMMQKSTGKLLNAQAKEEFIEFLCSFLFIPLGRVGHLLGGKTCFEAINNLYRSTIDLIGDKYFKTPNIKKRLMKLNVVHGCVSIRNILGLTEESLPYIYSHNLSLFSSVKYPMGQGCHLQRPRTYLVNDDLSVEPYCFFSIYSSLNEQGIHISDVEEVELKIGLKECLGILEASLTSTSALSDALLANKNMKAELCN